jgi:hypothetical protein
MLEAVLIDAKAGRNTYIETRTVRPGRPKERKAGRGKADATIGLFAFVIDSDADKGGLVASITSTAMPQQ